MTELALFAIPAALAALAWWAVRSPTSTESDVPADARVRFVLFRPSGNSFTIDAIVDAAMSTRLGAEGSTVTLRLERPDATPDGYELEAVLRRWAAEDRLVDVTLAADSSVASLRAHGSATRLRLVA